MESPGAEAGERTDEVTAPEYGSSSRCSRPATSGAELRERIDTLTANLAEAERAIAREQRNEYWRAVTQVKRLCRLHGFEHGQGAEIA
jgi:hypothetical protein